VSQGLTTLTIQLLDSPLIEHWGMWGVGVARLVLELIRQGEGKGHKFFQT
jgi:hypothetical protein